MPRKVDLEMESGEYFLAEGQKKAKQLAARDAKQDEGAAASKAKRQERFVPPKEQRRGAPGDNAVGAAPERSAAELVATLKAKGKGKRKAEEAPPAAAAVAAPEPKKKKKKKA
jgi:ribosomal RNA assembly protein